MALHVTIFSFGFSRSGLPRDRHGNGGGFVFDCRFLPNPVYVPHLAPLSGKDDAVVEYFAQQETALQFVDRVTAMIDSAVDSYLERGYEDLQVAFGCTGGQHRSVYCAERLTAHLRARGITVALHHAEEGAYW
ncbi:MAG: ATP-binding protein [Ignavibacteriae bacterium]|nr:ATP-binding protein [Ignavibacteriota bacterium]